MKPTKLPKPLNPILSQELTELGQWLRMLRSRRKMTIADMCSRIQVNPRTVSKIEKGDPTVSLGTFIAYLNILGLSRGLATRILGDYIHAVMTQKTPHIFKDEELDF